MEGLSTRLIHHPYRAPEGFEAVAVAVHKASTVFFPNVAALRTRRWQDKSGYTYGLHGTPTTFTLEERLAELEGARHCLLCPSGLAAIALVDLALLRSGDEVLIPDNAYGPNKALAEHELAAWGIGHRVYDPMDPADLAAAITPRTRLVWLEAAGSVTLEFPDVPSLVEVVRRANAGRERPIVTALDNTWAAGVAYQPFDWGVDVAMQALTKYPSGGADVLMGAVCTRDDTLHEALMMTHMRLGFGVGANDVEAVLRGLPTLELRYRAQDATARALAAWLAGQPHVARVLHPALPGSPGHDHWQRLAHGAAGLLTIVFECGVAPERVDAFCDALRRFRIGYSWAGPVSLCVPYDVPTMRRGPWPYAPRVVRLAIGLEHEADLRADLARALAVLG